MKKNKGFTLVELLAMLVVIGVLMAISIPNITGILSQSKNNQIEQDVIKMVDMAKIKMNTDKEAKYPEGENAILLTLSYIDDERDVLTGPNGGYYYRYDSFVVVLKEGNSYKYYVRLVENNNSYKFGVNIADYATFKKNKNSLIGNVDNFYEFDSNENIESRGVDDITGDDSKREYKFIAYLAKEEHN